MPLPSRARTTSTPCHPDPLPADPPPVPPPCCFHTVVKSITCSFLSHSPSRLGRRTGGSGKLQTSELNPLLMQQQVSFLVEQVREFSVETSDESLTPEHEQIQLRTGVNSYRFSPMPNPGRTWGSCSRTCLKGCTD